MYILSLDQASETGWALIDEHENIVNFGIIHNKKILDYDIKINFIKHEMIKLIKEHKPIIVTVEGVFANRLNLKTHHNLSKLQGVLINYFIENQILYEKIPSSRWQGNLNFGRNSKKNGTTKIKSINYVKEHKNIETDNDNIADAICMAIYAKREIRIETVK